MVASLFDKLKMAVMLLPVVLLLAFHVLRDNEWVSFIGAFGERDYRPTQASHAPAGEGSPWGVAMVLVLLIVMVSYKSSFDDRWFPLISR